MKFIRVDGMLINVERVNYFMQDNEKDIIVFVHYGQGETGMVKTTLNEIERLLMSTAVIKD